MSTKRVLVTGAFGYLGLALLRGLAPRFEVVGFGHAPRAESARRRIPSNVTVVEGDLLDVNAAFASHGPFDAVAHLAGGGGLHKVQEDPRAAVTSNVRGTSALLEAADAGGVRRRIFASTIAVYGTHRDHGRPYREDDIARPDDLYGVLKEAAEHVWTKLGGGIALRIANVYGAGCGVDLGLQGAAERFARAAAAGGALTVYGEGAQRIDYVHVDDVVAAFDRSLVAEHVPRLINVGGGAPVSIGALANACLDAGRSLGATPRLVRQPAPEGKVWPDRSLAIDLAGTSIGWRPRVSLADGVHGLVGMMKGQS